MKKNHLKYLLAFVCVAVIGCAAVQQRFPEKSTLEQATQFCAMGAVVPNNIRPSEREHYINDIAVPACLRANGIDATPADEK